jgi:hypothetical protein
MFDLITCCLALISLQQGYVRVPIWLDTLNSSASHDTDGWLSALQATATVADQAELEAAMEGSDPMDYGAVLAALAEPGPAPESLAKSVHLMRDSGLHCLGKVDLSNDAKLVELKVSQSSGDLVSACSDETWVG